MERIGRWLEWFFTCLWQAFMGQSQTGNQSHCPIVLTFSLSTVESLSAIPFAYVTRSPVTWLDSLPFNSYLANILFSKWLSVRLPSLLELVCFITSYNCIRKNWPWTAHSNTDWNECICSKAILDRIVLSNCSYIMGHYRDWVIEITLKLISSIIIW